MEPFFTASQNLWFTGALVLLAVFGVLQLVSLLSGFGFFSFLDGVLPDFEASGGEGGIDASALEPSVADALLGFLNFRKVPFVVGLLVFLFLFGAIGLKLQAFLLSTFGVFLTGWLAVPIVFAVSLFPLKGLNAVLGKIMPRDETMAVSRETFVGRVATITIGEATATLPAEAKLTGPLGRTHYVMVRSDNPEETFPQGTNVLIVGRVGPHFTVIPIQNPHLHR